jgi:hypothetical protein
MARRVTAAEKQGLRGLVVEADRQGDGIKPVMWMTGKESERRDSTKGKILRENDPFPKAQSSIGIEIVNNRQNEQRDQQKVEAAQ